MRPPFVYKQLPFQTLRIDPVCIFFVTLFGFLAFFARTALREALAFFGFIAAFGALGFFGLVARRTATVLAAILV